MAEAKFIEYKDKKIFLMDFSYSKIEQVLETIEQAKSVIAEQPEQSVLGLVDVSESGFNKELADALKKFAEHNKPYMKMSAVVGVTGIKQVIYRAVIKFTGRKNLVVKNTREEALDWLSGF